MEPIVLLESVEPRDVVRPGSRGGHFSDPHRTVRVHHHYAVMIQCRTSGLWTVQDGVVGTSYFGAWSKFMAYGECTMRGECGPVALVAVTDCSMLRDAFLAGGVVLSCMSPPQEMVGNHGVNWPLGNCQLWRTLNACFVSVKCWNHQTGTHG